MSDVRVRRMTPVLDLALEEEKRAARLLGECQQQFDDAEQRLRDLEYYSQEYAKGWAERGSQGVGRDWLINYQQFMGQMEAAIVQQTQTRDWHIQSLERARDQWRQRYQRVEALRQLIQRYQAEALAKADKQEQDLLDELSQRAFANRDKLS